MMDPGLTSKEAFEKLRAYGYNELPGSRSRTIVQIAGEVIKEPMFLLLIACGVLYLLLGDYREGIILMAAILVIITITFLQSSKTEKALDALKRLASPRALVIRDGAEKRIPGREVVEDDIIVLNEGDRVPADAVILDDINLSIDESLLTGESVAVIKTVCTVKEEKKGLVYAGTLVVQGKGLGRVIATGVRTEFGKIGISLGSIEEEPTRLQVEMKYLIRNLFIIGVLTSIGVVLAFYLSRGNFLQSLLNGLAASMAILPEEFPVVLTVFLAIGAWRLSGKKVLTRKPSAIETLGSATVLCTDKTGTLTQNKMEIVALYVGGQILEKKSFKISSQVVGELVQSAHRASQKHSIDPMEQAISKVYRSLDLSNEFEFNLVKSYPLNRDLLAMTQVIEDGNNDHLFVSAKGAPEAIFELCRLNDTDRARHESAVRMMAERGHRVIAVAKAKHPKGKLPASQHGFQFTFLGLIGLEDPVRPEVPTAIRECAAAGIKVIMITGDFPATARSISKQIGMAQDEELITGGQLKRMDDEELRKRIVRINIFARVIPEQKLRIVQALKANQEIVAMTGDGVNDAPALKAANIGVAMGNKGTDVAREASSLVLLDDNFASIVSAIRQGRRIFDNLQKAMSYILAIHIPIIGLTLLPALIAGIPILLMPLHIVFMELIIDPVCSVAFESEEEEKGIMERPPRPVDEKFFGARRILLSLFRGFILLGMVIAVYFLSLREGHSDDEVRAIAFSTLIIGNVFLILTSLSKTRSFIHVFKEKSSVAKLFLLASIVMLFAVLFIPGLNSVFSFKNPGIAHFFTAFGLAVLMLFIMESRKLRKHQSNRN